MSQNSSVFCFPENFSHNFLLNDPDIFYDAKIVKEFYHGYPYIHRLDQIDYLFSKASKYELMLWLDMNCTNKYRIDYLSIEPVNEEFPELDNIIQPMFGVEYMFVAFKEEKDYTWFIMRWL